MKSNCDRILDSSHWNTVYQPWKDHKQFNQRHKTSYQNWKRSAIRLKPPVQKKQQVAVLQTIHWFDNVHTWAPMFRPWKCLCGEKSDSIKVKELRTKKRLQNFLTNQNLHVHIPSAIAFTHTFAYSPPFDNAITFDTHTYNFGASFVCLENCKFQIFYEIW